MSDYVRLTGVFKIITKGKSISKDYLLATCDIWGVDYNKLDVDFDNNELMYLSDPSKHIMFSSNNNMLMYFEDTYKEKRGECSFQDITELDENTYKVNAVFYSGGTCSREVVDDLIKTLD